MNEMHKYEFKSFSKTLDLNLDLPKQDYNTFCSQESINEQILYQIRRTCNLRWPNQIHTQFHVLNLAKNNFCSMCN